MSVKQISLESFFSGGCKKRPNDGDNTETAADEKKGEKKAAFNQKYDDSYLKYCFVFTGNSHAPNPMCVICGDELANESMKPSKLLRHLETKHPPLRDKPLDYFERKKREQMGQQQLLKAATSTSVAALRASYLVDHIAKAKKPFTIREELILPVSKDICCEMFGKAAANKIGQIPLSATTVTRRIDDIAEDIEEQLLERVNQSQWYVLQVDESTDVDNSAILLCLCALYISRQNMMYMRRYCVRSLPTLNDYISGKLNWSFCVGICMFHLSMTDRHIPGRVVHWAWCQ